MSKFNLILLLSFIFLPLQARLQTLLTSPTDGMHSWDVGVNTRVTELPKTSPDLDNSLYLEDDWVVGSILLEDGRVIKKCTLRYDIGNGYIEIQDRTTIRAAAEKNVQQFTIETPPQTRWFVSGATFKSTKDPNYNLMEVLVDGDIKLLLSTKVEIIKPSGGFSDQRRAASGDPITSRKIVKYYMTQDEQLIDITSKSKLLKAFGNHQADMKLYAKESKTGFNKQHDLVTLVTYYAELVKKSPGK